MAYAIMRCKKLSSMGSVAASMQHCYRDRDTPNADKTRTADNEHHKAQSTDEAMGKLRDLLPEKRRKDAVLAVEYVITASPEWWGKATAAQQADFFEQSKKWLGDKYGAKNIVTASVHRDETSPHLSAFVVPLTQDGRLSAKEFIGNRTKMAKDQTTFAEAVKHLGLERGIERSRATHTSIKQHYAAIERGEAQHVTISAEAVLPKILKKGFLTRQEETPGAVAARLTKAVQDAYLPMVAKASISSQEHRRAKALQDTAKDQRSRLDRLQAPFKGLSKDQVADVLAMAMKFQRENALAKESQKQQIVERQREKRDHGRDGGGYSR